MLDTSDGTIQFPKRLEYLFSDFSIPKALRKYCDSTKQGKNSLKINSIFFNNDNLMRVINTEPYRNICSDPKSKWPGKKLCDVRNEDEIPNNFSLFDSKRYDQNPYDKEFANSPTSYQYYLKHKLEYEPIDKYAGFYKTKNDTFWISPNIKVGEEKEPMAAMCGPSADYNKKTISCRTTFQIKGDIYVEYYMNLLWADPEAGAAKAYKDVSDFLNFIGFKS